MTGDAYNMTGQASGGLGAALCIQDDRLLSARFFWDNVGLFREAEVCGELRKQTGNRFEAFMKGVFDCSGVGGCPSGTSAPFQCILSFDIKA